MVPSNHSLPALAALVALCSASCATMAAGTGPLKVDEACWAATGAELPVALLRTPGQERVSIDEAADELAEADVVFLGEQHDSAEGHAVQLALTKAIAERRGRIVLSMEMLERDSQRLIDMYVDGKIDQAEFRATARLWPNYQEHYEPAVEFARAGGHDIVAANVYRPIASRVARQGLDSAMGEIWAAASVDVSPGEYRDRFDAVMSGHGEVDAAVMDRFFAAQCIKDDTMAESIARRIACDPGEPPVVIHWNGRFHSDYGLGTVERLRSRQPDLNIAVVSMLTDVQLSRPLAEEALNQGHYIVLVQAPKEDPEED
jgi:uncharacterized iron-regulated protein